MSDRYVEIVERRSEPRTILDKFHSVEFLTSGIYYVHQFKIWDTSSHGMSILIKEDSNLLRHLKVGKILDMKYYTSEASKPTEYLKTEIKHITKHDEGRFKGHYSVGIAILKNENPDQ